MSERAYILLFLLSATFLSLHSFFTFFLYILSIHSFFPFSLGFFDSQQDPPSRIIYNTGLTSLLSNNKPLIMEELILVTAHELGHNWGTHHDPPTGRCSNIWLMNEFAQDGTQQSHRVSE